MKIKYNVFDNAKYVTSVINNKCLHCRFYLQLVKCFIKDVQPSNIKADLRLCKGFHFTKSGFNKTWVRLPLRAWIQYMWKDV